MFVRLGSHTQLPSLTTVVHVKPQGAGARLTFKQLSANTVPAMLRAHDGAEHDSDQTSGHVHLPLTILALRDPVPKGTVHL